jgi:hypothetical protein
MTSSAARSAGRGSRERSSAVIARGRTAASRSAKRAFAAGSRRTRSSWPTTTAAGSRRTGTRSEPSSGATGSGSATTPSIESEGEPTPADAIGSGEPRTPSIGSADEPTTAAIGSEGEKSMPDRRLGGLVVGDLPGLLDAALAVAPGLERGIGDAGQAFRLGHAASVLPAATVLWGRNPRLTLTSQWRARSPTTTPSFAR